MQSVLTLVVLKQQDLQEHMSHTAHVCLPGYGMWRLWYYGCGITWYFSITHTTTCFSSNVAACVSAAVCCSPPPTVTDSPMSYTVYLHNQQQAWLTYKAVSQHHRVLHNQPCLDSEDYEIVPAVSI